jgi:hypothetical protein
LVALFLYVAVHDPLPPPREEPTVADQFASDRPITASDPDPLDFHALTSGLSRFLRNAHTEPPLTIAITGEWGTGKSSLMNLLREDLGEWGFRPVWFNAWHHQKEESLLATLLQNVRIQAIPQWWRPENWIFRARLLAIRFRRHIVLTLLIVSIVALAAGILVAAPRPVGHVQESYIYHICDELIHFNRSRVPSDFPPQLLFLITVFGSAFSLWKGLQAFGVNPATLMAATSGNSGLKALQAQTGFRYQFAQEFKTVTEALGPRSMIIFIDDLDRCQPGQVVEVLEAVNFLVTSGDCFVVLGMARDRVERCVGLSFKDVAGELITINGGSAPVAPQGEAIRGGNANQQNAEDAAREKRAEFARQYLDKLINIEVPVPRLTADQTLKLLARKKAEAELESQRRLRWRPWAVRLGRLSPFALAALILAAGVVIGVHVGHQWVPAQESANQSGGVMTTPAATQSPTPSPTSPRLNKGSTEEVAPAEVQAAELAQPLPVSRWLLYLFMLPGGVVVGGVAYWVLTRRPGLVIDDSPEFRDALEIWSPLIFAKEGTPRSVKRFLNRLRYVASRQRP